MVGVGFRRGGDFSGSGEVGGEWERGGSVDWVVWWKWIRVFSGQSSDCYA